VTEALGFDHGTRILLSSPRLEQDSRFGRHVSVRAGSFNRSDPALVCPENVHRQQHVAWKYGENLALRGGPPHDL